MRARLLAFGYFPEQVVTLYVPDHRDVVDFGCPATPQTVRLVHDQTPSGRVRVLMTNALDQSCFPAEAFGDLYHGRWRIEGHSSGSNNRSISSTSPDCRGRY